MLMTGLFVANATQAGADPINCPDGFQLTEDQKSCYDHPVIVTTQAPVDCEVGHLTPDKSACYTDVSYVTQAPTSQNEVIDAHVSMNAPTVTCPTGYTAKANNLCSSTVAVPDNTTGPIPSTTPGTPYCADGSPVKSGNLCTVAGTTTVPGSYIPGTAGTPAVPGTPGTPGTPATCPAGTDASVTQNGLCKNTDAPPLPEPCLGSEIQVMATFDNGHQKTVCYAATPQIPATPATPGTPTIPAIPATPATCNGVSTTQPIGSCVTVQGTTQTIAALVTAPVTTATCPAGFSPKNDGALCSMAQAAQAVQQPATVSANPDTVTCPSGYDGPSSNNQCTRTILTAQPDVPVCKAGTLLDIGNGFVCLLDNAPVAPAPETSPSCPKGEYDAKADLCIIHATTGTHPGSVAVGPKAAAAGGAIAPAFTG